jgi:hypothetical protein
MEIHFLFLRKNCEDNTKLLQKFLRKLRDKKPQLKKTLIKILFLQIYQQQIFKI